MILKWLLCSDMCLGYVPWVMAIITKTYRYNFESLKPHFYIVKQGYSLSFLLLLKNIDCRYPFEPPRFQRVHTIYVLSINKKNVRVFFKRFFFIFEVKLSIYLNRRVVVVFFFFFCNDFMSTDDYSASTGGSNYLHILHITSCINASYCFYRCDFTSVDFIDE